MDVYMAQGMSKVKLMEANIIKLADIKKYSTGVMA